MKSSEETDTAFRKVFDDFQVQPSDKVWEHIHADRMLKQDMGMTEETPEAIYGGVFNHFTTNPSSAVWSGIRGYLIRKSWNRALRRAAWVLFLGTLLSTYFYYSKTKEAPLLNEIRQSSSANKSNESEITSPVPQNSQTQFSEGLNSNHTPPVKSIALPGLQRLAAAGRSGKSDGSNSAETMFQSPVRERLASGNFLEGKSAIQPDKKSVENELAAPDSLQETKPDVLVANQLPPDEKKTPVVQPLKKNIYHKHTDINNETSPWKLGFMAGLDYGNYSLSGGSSLYREVRKSQELFQPGSFHFGVTFSKMLNSRWYLQGNIVYSNQVMLVAYNRKVTQADTLKDGSGNIIRIDQKTIFSVDTNTNFKFSTLEIPLMLGYRFGEHRWSFHAMVGPTWNLILAASGAMLSPQTMQVASLETLPLVRQQWGLWLAGGASYQVNHHIGLTFEPVFRYKFSSIFQSGFPVKQHNYATGLNIGIRYHIK